MATEYEELNIPPEFQTYADRHHLEYRQTPPGIALYLGVGALFLGLLFSTAPMVSSDRTIGYGMLGLGVVLLIASRVLHVRKRRHEEELYDRYLRWKAQQSEHLDAQE
ncbi:hypothetical protein [Micromonospora sp. NPDC048842]|uniref:hypothetical protein n=1 Tax=unclassified Micromonospora TaxID=2617518 RepID=UPI0033CDB99C